MRGTEINVLIHILSNAIGVLIYLVITGLLVLSLRFSEGKQDLRQRDLNKTGVGKGENEDF